MKREKKLSKLTEKINRIIFRLTGGRIPGREEVEQNLRLLYVGADTARIAKEYYREKTALLLKIFLAGLLLALFLTLTAENRELLRDGYFLPRQASAYEAGLKYAQEEGISGELYVSVEPQRLSREESRALLKRLSGSLEDYILGDNSSLDEVRSNLNLLREIGTEGAVVTVDWDLDSYETLNLDGSLRTENLKEEGSLVTLRAVLSCNGEEAVYQGAARVLPPVLSAGELFAQELEAELERLNQESSESGMQELPARLQGRTLIWKEESSAFSAAAVMLLTILSGILIFGAKDRELKQRTREREIQMKQDYVRIVSKLVLLMGAGETIRHAWDTIVRDYQIKREAKQTELRYAYEEMLLTSHEIQNGIAEARAYESFGVRCRLPSYLKLSALLEQNLKKGNRGLTELLQLEVREAFEQRRELARCRGEEAATRLLFPMILMLLVVMLLILVPAGMSMQI